MICISKQTTQILQPFLRKKYKFIGLLQRKIGEQKIDVVIKGPSSNTDLLIYKETQRAGVLLMKKEVPLEYHIATAGRHAKRLQEALDHVKTLCPVTAQDIETLPSSDISYLDMLSTRFSKLQYLLGSRIFASVLEIVGDESITFIDKLNELEKLCFLDDANWWIDLRDLRNDVSHDYPDDSPDVRRPVRRPQLAAPLDGLRGAGRGRPRADPQRARDGGRAVRDGRACLSCCPRSAARAGS